MTDVGKVEGPSGPPENLGKKDKASIDADKFREAMRRRVTEVSQVDPDEQKKRKRREEAEEEEFPEQLSEGPTTPASQVTPFSLEEETRKASPLEMQKEGRGISPTESAQKMTLPSPPAPFFQTPSADEMSDDSGLLEEEAFIETVPGEAPGGAKAGFGEEQAAPPPPPPVEQPPQAPPPPQPPYPSPQAAQAMPSESMTPEAEKPVVSGPPESGQPETGKKPPQKKPEKPPVGPPKKKPSGPGLELKLTGLKEEEVKRATREEKKGTTAAEMGAPPSKAEETAGFFEQLGKEGRKKPAKTPEELEKEAELQEIASTQGTPPPFAPAAGKEGKKTEEKETTAEMELGVPITPGEVISQEAPPITPEALPSYANLHPQVMELFDRMVGVMTVMTMTGMTETVITLNAPQFASSVFFGTQIIIQEFSTAPQAFNIQLNGTPQAVALFQGNANDLMAAFQAGNYNFRVNRLETGYLTERPLFKRKERAGEEEKETGENPQ